MLSLLLLLLLIFSHTSTSSEPINQIQPQKPSLNLFILAGQSNMAGRGGVVNDTVTHILKWDGIIPPESQPNPSILRLTKDYVWVKAAEPLHADIDETKVNGIGPGIPFANAILTGDPEIGVVGLVPCAIGGTNISEWRKGGLIYEELVKRCRFAGRSGVFRGVLWYQGESDTVSKEDGELYKGKLVKFFNDLRSDLEHPTLPVFQVAIASGPGPYIKIVRRAQLNIGLINVRTVDAKGLPLEPDRLHLTTPAQVRLGQMLAGSFLQSTHITIRTTNYSNTSTNNIHNISIFYFFMIYLLQSLLFIIYHQ